MAKYEKAVIFTKKGNLHDYFYTDKICYGRFQAKPSESWKAWYEAEREIQLIALFRHEGRKYLCRIKCPVNPLPVKGEFELPSYSALYSFLKANGWEYKKTLYPGMFE